MPSSQPVINKQRSVQLVSGISGVNPGGNINIVVPVNFRYFDITLLCMAVNYTGGQPVVPTNIKSANGAPGTGTIKLTISNGIAISIVGTAGTSAGYVLGDTITVADPTGAGIILSNNGNGATLATANWTIASTGTPTPISPGVFFSTLQQLPNGKNVRDISPSQILALLIANGQVPQLGELPLMYADPRMKYRDKPYALSWDMFAQDSFTIKGQISQLVTLPTLVGVYVRDSQRNGTMAGSAFTPSLKVISQHAYSYNLVAGVNLINNIPITYPIRRMWIVGGTPGNITNLEIDQDGNKIYEIPVIQQNELLARYGFTFATPAQNSASAQSTTVPNGIVQSNVFDTAYISDPDDNIYQSLSCASSLVVRLTSNIAQPATIIVEAVQGAYA